MFMATETGDKSYWWPFQEWATPTAALPTVNNTDFAKQISQNKSQMFSLIAFVSAMTLSCVLSLCAFGAIVSVVIFALWFYQAPVRSTSARRHIYVIKLTQSPYCLNYKVLKYLCVWWTKKSWKTALLLLEKLCRFLGFGNAWLC